MTDRKTTNTDMMWACLLIISIGSLGAWHYSRKLIKAFRTEAWQPVAGEILQSEMLLVSPGMTSKSYAEFEYAYRVDGRVFESEPPSEGLRQRVSWANTGPSGVGLYSEGESVTVYVNPSAPYEAVLIQGPNTWTYVQISLCATFAAVGIWLLFVVVIKGS